VSVERMAVCDSVVRAINERMDANDVHGAYGELVGITDPEEKTYLWPKLDSKTRSSLKAHAQSIKN